MENEEIKVEEVQQEEIKVEEIKEEQPKTPKKGDKKKIIIIVVIILLLIAINAIVAIILIKNDKNKNNNTTTTVTTTVKTEFKITFNSNGGDPIDDMEVKLNEKVKLPTPKHEGYEFLYWSDENDIMYNETATFDKDTNLTANWKDKTAKTMKITFDSKGGSKVDTVTYQCSEDNSVVIKSLPKNPTKDKYVFRAWEDKNGKVILVDAKLTCENVTLYATYDKAAEEPKCPEGYDLTATDTLCVRREDATEGCDITHEKEIDGKCYSVRTYKQATCKVQTGSTGSGSSIQPILSDGKVIYKDSSEAYCVYGSASDCDTYPERKVQGICYERVEMRPTTTVCSSDQKYLIGNQLYGTKEKGTGASTGCYTPTDKHKICPENYNYNEVEGKCISSVKPIGWE